MRAVGGEACSDILLRQDTPTSEDDIKCLTSAILPYVPIHEPERCFARNPPIFLHECGDRTQASLYISALIVERLVHIKNNHWHGRIKSFLCLTIVSRRGTNG